MGFDQDFFHRGCFGFSIQEDLVVFDKDGILPFFHSEDRIASVRIENDDVLFPFVLQGKGNDVEILAKRCEMRINFIEGMHPEQILPFAQRDQTFHVGH